MHIHHDTYTWTNTRSGKTKSLLLDRLTSPTRKHIKHSIIYMYIYHIHTLTVYSVNRFSHPGLHASRIAGMGSTGSACHNSNIRNIKALPLPISPSISLSLSLRTLPHPHHTTTPFVNPNQSSYHCELSLLLTRTQFLASYSSVATLAGVGRWLQPTEYTY